MQQPKSGPHASRMPNSRISPEEHALDSLREEQLLKELAAQREKSAPLGLKLMGSPKRAIVKALYERVLNGLCRILTKGILGFIKRVLTMAHAAPLNPLKIVGFWNFWVQSYHFAAT